MMMTPPGQPPADPAPRAAYTIGRHGFGAAKATPGLHLVATPIGNLGDITLRALETLAGADMIACEDTRVTRKLLDRYGIQTRLVPYHEHNAAQMRPRLLSDLAQGMAIALVSDAGTPLISDPGYKLVRDAVAQGAQVVTLPGASSVLAALTLAGLPTDRFFFEGFLPAKAGARQTRLAELANIPATLILFEAGSRIVASLADLADAFGAREAAICRELTKMHEEVRRGALNNLARASDIETRGEFVIVIAPPDAQDQTMSMDEIDALLRRAMAQTTLKNAVAEVAQIAGRAKRDIYARALALQEGQSDER